MYSFFFSSPPGRNTYIYSTAASDTIFQGQTYRKVFHGTSYYGAYRVDSLDQVWFLNYNDSSACLLYDFGMAIGDSLSFGSMFANNHFGGKLLSVSSGNPVKYEMALFHPAFPSDTIHDTWVWGAGSLIHPFDPMWMYNVSDWTTELICSYQNGAEYYLNPPPYLIFGSCYGSWSPVGLEAPAEKIQLFPNPARNKIKVRHASPGMRWVIYDNLGNSRRWGNIQSIEEELDLSGLQPGFYILSLQFKGIITAHKFVLE